MNCLIVQFNYQLLTYNINTAMNAVFKQYNVCDDIADIIAKQVHKGYQDELNKHISVLVKWNEEFDYWKFHNVRVETRKLLDSKIIQETKGYLNISGWCSLDNIYHVLDSISNMKKKTYDYKYMNSLMSNEEYLKYVWSGKKVFSILSIPRWSSMMLFCIRNLKKINMLYQSSTISKMIRSIRIAIQIKLKNEVESSTLYKLSLSNVIIDPVTIATNYKKNNFLGYSKISKKILISFLNQNGNPKKLTNKKKNELWKMVYNV